jgi:glycine hydroxymethyltransferase
MVSARSKDTWNECLNTSLKEEDSEIYDLVQKEKVRQFSGLELIASEVSPISFWSLRLVER